MAAKIESIGAATRHSDFTNNDDGIESFNFFAWIVLWIFACSFEVVNNQVICSLDHGLAWADDNGFFLAVIWILSLQFFVNTCDGYLHLRSCYEARSSLMNLLIFYIVYVFIECP